MSKKLLITVVALSVVLCVAVTGTIAWLSQKTETITNTFTPSNINITLTENTEEYKMVPGTVIKKDPKVTIAPNSEPCYVFVQIQEDLGAWKQEGVEFQNYLSYGLETGWVELDGAVNVYYRQVDADTAKNGISYDVLSGNQVTVSHTVTKEMMNALEVENAALPKLTFAAYAIQSENLTDQNNDSIVDVADAWTLLNSNT